ncbi:SDR family oxidoreductase [Dyadobacter sp. OTU695]|uniref:SDR family oxidoreductase n=1 Tax=Dyadobacter sp. OTU695 TaxID=3043860 RepID=UPI00313B9ACA
MKNLEGKNALVTGGNSGIGYATALELKQQGAQVIITGRRTEAVDKAAAELGVYGKVADQASLDSIEELAQHVSDRFGKIDILFINAGVTGKSTIEQTSESFWHQLTDVNLKGAYFTLSRLIPILRDGASVIFLSSTVATRTIPGSSVYALSKAAINSVVKTAALELAPRKIRVNAISPGPTETEVFDKMGLDHDRIQEVKGALKSKIPLATLGDPADVAKMVAYLSSAQSRFITGSEILIDGGMTLL